MPRIHRSRTRPGLGPVASRIPRAAVLTVDVAKRAGVALYLHGRLHHYDEIDTMRGPDRRAVLTAAATMAEVRDMPLVCALEVPFGGQWHAALSLSASVALWRDTWLGALHPQHRLMECTAAEWRRPLFGSGGLPRAEARRLEGLYAAKVAAHDMPGQRHYVIGPDAAAAICMGQVVTRSAALQQLLHEHPAALDVRARAPRAPRQRHRA